MSDIWIPRRQKVTSFEATVEADAIAARDLRPTRWIVATPNTTAIETFGWPTVTAVEDAANNYVDANGYYYKQTTANSLDDSVSLSTSVAVARVAHRPDITFCFQANTVSSRVWCGLFSADPTGYQTLLDATAAGMNGVAPTGTISGVGLMYDSYLAAPSTATTNGLVSVVVTNGSPSTYARADAGSFWKDGFRVGQVVWWLGGGFANDANHTSSYPKTITAISANGVTMSVAEACVNETTSGATPVYVQAITSSRSPYVRAFVGGTTGGDSVTEDKTSLSTAAFTNTEFTIWRIRYVGSSEWEFTVSGSDGSPKYKTTVTDAALVETTGLKLFMSATALRTASNGTATKSLWTSSIALRSD